eukprot:11653637-Prorocentrum_lima.AAC.1
MAVARDTFVDICVAIAVSVAASKIRKQSWLIAKSCLYRSVLTHSGEAVLGNDCFCKKLLGVKSSDPPLQKMLLLSRRRD